ncbi:uncharacterized protein LOC134660414 [Cydia amplana]|uniref:uncharacterized protein LOC134660414 n=1 Tax=Cydia amplana TaxID=1869771 RepID=UPI002FE5B3F8
MLFLIYLLSFLLHFTTSRVNKNLKISCGLDEVTRDSVAMRFYVQIENTGNDCKVECIPGRCCTEQGDEENCDVLKLFGGCLQNVPSGESRTVRLAAPLLEPFERRGFCVVHVNSKLKDHPLYRDTVTILFDTGRPSDVTPCARDDQDALNDCQPVNCETYYNGHKPHFSKRLKRCLAAVACSEDYIYNEDLNRCVSPITDEDIKEIESLSNENMMSSQNKIVVANNTKTLNLDVIKEKRDLDISQNIIEDYDVHKLPIKFLACLKSPNILLCVICMQCCFVLLLAYYVRDRCWCVSKDKEVLNKFYNYKQEESITTPLISVSRGTVTTCQFQTDSSSNIDRKIQFYKACQDKRAKASMSDDILSRCLKRRDWIAKPKSSELIKSKEFGIQVCDTEKSGIEKTSTKQDMLPAISSEQQVKCFEYEPHNFYTRYVTELQRTHSLADNCAQASFPKDSIDDFLSERCHTQSNSISGSSGTSKSNLDKVLSLLSQKIGPLSGPGSEEVELLHMPRATVYSSSNESDYETKRIKESSSSL